MTADRYAEQKASIRAAIEEAKAGPHPFLALRQMEQRAMDAWPHLVTVMRGALQAVNALRTQAGIEPEPVDADALEFGNWIVAQVRAARREMDE